MRKILSFALALCMVFALAACGKKADSTLNAQFNALYLRDDAQQVIDEVMAVEGMAEAFHVQDFEATFSDPSAFRGYNAEIALSNQNDFPVNVLGLTMDDKDSGKNGVYICTYTDAMVGMPAHFTGEQTLFCSVLADKKLSMEDILQTLNKMNIRCQYVNAESGIEEYVDLTEEDVLLESIVRYS